ncbi:Cytosine-specific methyltransferase [Candidatus Omnitrophus magneticus]|uniref:Cytosine-specific methyltransferase n=1 Tax=Candidatus Omnitrophus magneticus TaxID=1609969 RepID=A0A0F0CRF4_9BACT|nr:Cytosine-specific methyltransferase [Candidatus Omnitrophus magneticus]
MERLKVISLFCGCGGTDLGIEGGFSFLGKEYPRHPTELTYANDFDSQAAGIFDANFGIRCSVRDIRKVSANTIPDHDILTGGFPCQSFSIVAQNPPRLGCKDAKGQLFFEMCRILKQKKPRVFVAENVKGILSANSGESFPLIIAAFEKCGYIVSWHLLNAADYGVPQRRERVFIVGIRKDIGKKFIPPPPTHSLSGDLVTSQWVALKKCLEPHESVPDKYYFSDKACHGMLKANPKMNKGRAQDEDKACNTVGAHLAKVSLNSTDPVLKVNGRYRRFTPREVARIQSFPDTFKLTGSEAAQYRALGNAIPPVLMWHVVRQLQCVLTGKVTDDTRTIKEKRSHNMARISSKRTVIENVLGAGLKKSGLKNQRNVKSITGKPDFIFKQERIAIFCDSEFWHGEHCSDTVDRIKTNRNFWKEKIQRNILRDREVTKELKGEGWIVMRFWEKDIKERLDKVLLKINKALEDRRQRINDL